MSFIYEPKQDCSIDGFELLEDPLQCEVDKLATKLGLNQIGMIYTDLQNDKDNPGKVICKRNSDSFFVSSLEAVFIAQMQLKNPSPCKFSSSGHFGSKYVTVIVTGDNEGQVGLTEFQVSNSCMAMVDAGIIEPSIDPSLVLVKESSKTLYVPEVFYKDKNEYGVVVQSAAKPTFPVDYLLTRVTIIF